MSAHNCTLMSIYSQVDDSCNILLYFCRSQCVLLQCHDIAGTSIAEPIRCIFGFTGTVCNVSRAKNRAGRGSTVQYLPSHASAFESGIYRGTAGIGKVGPTLPVPLRLRVWIASVRSQRWLSSPLPHLAFSLNTRRNAAQKRGSSGIAWLYNSVKSKLDRELKWNGHVHRDYTYFWDALHTITRTTVVILSRSCLSLLFLLQLEEELKPV